ncbi:MAG: MBL fold metallo-hydrolase [Acidobacteria bacterium]|nr:MBL fold metallo-hydrolase [Acidobacteriota bacterium]
MLIGDYLVEIIPDTEFRLDGGAMFGVVPRVLWEKVCPPDELNRIRLNMNCVFIDTGKEKILIETGIGEKWTEKEAKIYGIFREKPFAQSLFEITGSRPEDITIVINTHLHFDHAGGNTIPTEKQASRSPVAEASETRDERAVPTAVAGGDLSDISKMRPQFRNARYLISKSEFVHAQHPHERDRASYLRENWLPLRETGQLELLPDSYEPVEGLKLQQIRGHSETMQTWRLDRGGQTVYGFADLIPTRHHLALPWIMGYDLYPAETLEFKKAILPQAVREGWHCLFYHDFETPLCRLREGNGKIVAVEYVQA